MESHDYFNHLSDKLRVIGRCSAIRIRAAAGDPRRGWLTAGGQTIPVALGRGGIRANKREGDGGTPKGTFRPRQLWWRADRHPRPRTFLPVRAIRPEDAWCEDPASRHYNQPVRLDRDQRRRPAHARRPSLRFHRRDRPQHPPAHRRPRQRGIPASGAREFSADRRLRLDDEIGDAAAAAAARAGDEDRDWVKRRSEGHQKHARQKSDRGRVARPCTIIGAPAPSSTASKHRMRPRDRAEGYAIQAAIETYSAAKPVRLEDRGHQRGRAEAHQCRWPDGRTHPVRDRDCRWRHGLDGRKRDARRRA